MSTVSDRFAHLSPIKRAFLELQSLQQKLDHVERARQEPIAVIGMGCRFPAGANDPGAFWRLLRDGVDAVTEVPAERWDVEALFDPDPDMPGKTYTRWGAFLRGVSVAGFDTAFFGISPREAAGIDPQHRLALEVAWEALEDAGQVPSRLVGSATGVFMGIMTRDYQDLQSRLAGLEGIDAYQGVGNEFSFLAGRLSYVLGLQGPSMAVSTACSSSLVTAHLACQSLRSGESDLALVGGVNLILAPDYHVISSRIRSQAPDGRCKTFDASANGYVRGEGCGVLVLKRLSDALADGDRVQALIRGTAVNSDGASGGLTVPSGSAQQAVVRKALEAAGVAPAEVAYVEAHGTGTPLGDPIEVRALSAVLGQGRDPDDRVLLGSVKTNIGHLEAAAGVAGLIKVVLAMQHGEIPPHLHFKEPSPHISWSELPVEVPVEARRWPPGPRRRVAGVSSFGLSGINAHVVLEAPEVPEVAPRTEPLAYLLPLSARSPEALKEMAGRFRDFLGGDGAADLVDVCSTAMFRREHHDHRLCVSGSTREELTEQLDAFTRGETRPFMAAGIRRAGQPKKVVFVFPGQGSQWPGMTRRLLACEPAFEAALKRCAEAIDPLLGLSLVDALAASPPSPHLDAIGVIQPALFAIGVALSALWRSWGVEPDAVVGHSMGEVAAAHVAGALSLEDAAKIICQRSRLLERVRGRGAMAVVELSSADARAAISGFEDLLSVAVSNSSRSTVLSGDPAALDEVLGELDRRGVFCRRVKVDVASHSPQMDALRDDLLTALGELAPGSAAVPMCSSVTSAMVAGPELDAAYWYRNLREPVRFSDVVKRLAEQEHGVFIEMSPHPILLAPIEEEVRHLGKTAVLVPSLRRQEDEGRTMLGALGALHASGYPVDFSKRHPTRGGCVSLPTYPWQRERCWTAVDAAKSSAEPPRRGARAASGHPLIGEPVALSVQPGAYLWEMDVRAEDPGYLDDHRVDGAAILPAAAYIELALAAAAALPGAAAQELAAIALETAMVLPPEVALRVQLVFSPPEEGVTRFQFFSRLPTLTTWTLHATGSLHAAVTAEALESVALPEIDVRCDQDISGERHQQAMRERGLQYGPAFHGLESLRVGRAEALGRLSLPRSLRSEQGVYLIHPVLLDAALQVLGSLTPPGQTYLPVRVGRLRLLRPPPPALFCHARIRPRAQGGDADMVEGELRLLDEDGAVVLEALDVVLKRIQRAPADGLAELLHEIAWRALPRPAPRAATEPGRWLIFTDGDGGAADALRGGLEARGDSCVMIDVGVAYQRTTPSRYVVDPSDPASFKELLREAFAGGAPCRGVVHLGSWSGSPEQGYGAVLHLVQALATAIRRDVPRLWLVTSGVQLPEAAAVSAGAVHQAALWGMGRVIVHEHPELRCSLVDIAASGAAEIPDLVAEILADGPEDQVVLRAGARFVPRLVRRAPTPPLDALCLRADATYLVTGGLGGLGLVLARWLVERGVRHLLLVGRRAPSEAAIQSIEAMRSGGAEVVVASADVSRAADVARLLTAIDDDPRLPPLAGIFHAAAVLDDGILLKLGRERFDAVMAPKAGGAWNLHLATSDRPLDLFVLFSSAAAVLGSMGQANYAAANAVLDALAHHRRASGLAAASINWGAWADVGWVAAEAARGERLATQGIQGMPTDVGLRALEQVLQLGAAQTTVVSLDLRQWQEANLAVVGTPLLAELASSRPPRKRDSELRAVLEATEPAQRRAVFERRLRELIGQVLRLDPARIDPATPIGTLGLDSLMGLEIRNRLEASLGLTISATLLWTVPTVAALAPYLAEKLGLSLQLDAREATPSEPARPPERLSSKEGERAVQALEQLKHVSADDLRRALGRARGNSGKRQ